MCKNFFLIIFFKIKDNIMAKKKRIILYKIAVEQHKNLFLYELH